MPGYVVVVGGKATSSWKSFFAKGKKLFTPASSLKDLWRTSRGVIDTIAQSVGIPMAQVRQGLRNNGVDPDKYDSAMMSMWESSPPDQSTTEALQQQFDTAEEAAKNTMPATLWVALGVGVLLVTMFSRGGGGRRRGRSFRPRFRSARRRRRRYR